MAGFIPPATGATSGKEPVIRAACKTLVGCGRGSGHGLSFGDRGVAFGDLAGSGPKIGAGAHPVAERQARIRMTAWAFRWPAAATTRPSSPRCRASIAWPMVRDSVGGLLRLRHLVSSRLGLLPSQPHQNIHPHHLRPCRRRRQSRHLQLPTRNIDYRAILQQKVMMVTRVGVEMRL